MFFFFKKNQIFCFCLLYIYIILFSEEMFAFRAGSARIGFAFRGVRAYSAVAPAVDAVPLESGPSSSLPSNDRNISLKINQLVDQIASLSVLEVADLNYALKKKLNIPDQPVFAAPVAAAAPAGKLSLLSMKCFMFRSRSRPFILFLISGGADVAEEEAPAAAQKTVFAVKLLKFDDSKKITLVKEIRNAIEGLNLVQAKKFVETAPVEVKGDLGKNEAEALKELLEKAGATIEIV